MIKPYRLAAMVLAFITAGPSLAANVCPVAGFTLVEPKASAATRPVVGPGRRVVHVRREALTTIGDIVEVRSDGDKVDGQVLLKFKPAAEARLSAVTTNNPGVRIAFVVDDEAVLAFTWEGPYGIDPGGSQLSLEKGYERARRIAERIRPCIGSSGVL